MYELKDWGYSVLIFFKVKEYDSWKLGLEIWIFFLKMENGEKIGDWGYWDHPYDTPFKMDAF